MNPYFDLFLLLPMEETSLSDVLQFSDFVKVFCLRTDGLATGICFAVSICNLLDEPGLEE